MEFICFYSLYDQIHFKHHIIVSFTFFHIPVVCMMTQNLNKQLPWVFNEHADTILIIALLRRAKVSPFAIYAFYAFYAWLYFEVTHQAKQMATFLYALNGHICVSSCCFSEVTVSSTKRWWQQQGTCSDVVMASNILSKSTVPIHRYRSFLRIKSTKSSMIVHDGDSTLWQGKDT